MGYTPHPGDLSYPEKLEMMESIAESISSQEADQPGNSTILAKVCTTHKGKHRLIKRWQFLTVNETSNYVLMILFTVFRGGVLVNETISN